MTILSSVSAVNVCCCVCHDQCSTTSPLRCVNRRCRSWHKLTLSIWRIPAVGADGWWATWREMGSRSAVTGFETSCAAWDYGRSTRNHAQPLPGIHLRGSPAWWMSLRSQLLIRCGPQISPTSRSRRASSTWWRSCICSPGTCSAGGCPAALTRSFLDALEAALEGGRKPEIFHSAQGCQCVETVENSQVRGGLHPCLLRWLGGRDQPGEISVEVLLCKTAQLPGGLNSP
jgi:hypothetical protein